MYFAIQCEKSQSLNGLDPIPWQQCLLDREETYFCSTCAAAVSRVEEDSALHPQNSVMSCFSLCRMMLAPLLQPVHEALPSSSKIHQVLI